METWGPDVKSRVVVTVSRRFLERLGLGIIRLIYIELLRSN